MNHWRFSILAGLILFSACPQESANDGANDFTYQPIPVTYPPSFRDTSVVDVYFGKRVRDPYRWLEQDTSAAVGSWVAAQQAITKDYLEEIPYRQAIHNRLADLWRYVRYGLPEYKGGNYYQFGNSGAQNQDVLYRARKLGDSLQLVLDPNLLSREGTVALSQPSFSHDGSLMAYQLSSAGSDWQRIHVRDLERNQDIRDTLRWVKFSNIAWAGSGFYYSRYPPPARGQSAAEANEFHQLYYHRVGDPQSEDQLVFADRLHPNRNVYARTSRDERYLVIQVVESTSGNALYFRDLEADDPSFVPLVDSFDADFELIDGFDNKLLLLTNRNAPNRRVIQVNTRRPEPAYWEEIIPERSDALQSVERIGNYLIATYLHNVVSQVVIFTLDGKEVKKIDLPGLGSVTDFTEGKDGQEAFFAFTSFTQPETIYRLDLVDFTTSVYSRPQVDFAADQYETRQVWYESYDGERIPMFIIHKKGLKADGLRPTLLYGYGGFNISMVPQWNATRLLLFPIILENGGVCAVANIRGGGEFGRRWHEGGTLRNKKNVFDDFQAAAEYLISNNYTRPEKLGIYGRSNGGLLVGACLAQRPDLYGVALPAVGVMDMLRYHRFTIGWAWATDYGTSADSTMFDYLNAYSPLHNLEPTRYPATLITTADHDDRVVPAHSFKFAAELQRQQKGDAPVLIRIEPSAGHGAGKPVSKRIDEGADVLSFFFYNLREGVIYR